MDYQSESIGALAKALCAAQGEITFALKDCTADMGVKGGKRKYADLQSVIDAVKPALVKNELAYVQQTMPAQEGIALRTTLMHSSGEWIAGEIRLPIDRMGGIQGMGSALTYARRYALSSIIGVAPDEDDDGQTAQDAWNQRKQGNQPAPRQNAPQKAAQRPEMPAEMKAKVSEVWNALADAGFQSKEDRLHEIGRIIGKPVQGSAELTMDDCDAVLWSLKQPKTEPSDCPFPE